MNASVMVALKIFIVDNYLMLQTTKHSLSTDKKTGGKRAHNSCVAIVNTWLCNVLNYHAKPSLLTEQHHFGNCAV